MKLFAADVAPPGFTGLDFLTLGSRPAFQIGFVALVVAVVLFFVLRRFKVARLAAALAALGLFIAADVATYLVVSREAAAGRTAAQERRHADYERREAARKARATGSSAAPAEQAR